ncbi:acyl-CoA dehydrogenase C-terminal domain-containing protein [Laribacter hongkongensis]|uniref:acyl-CoA dehydrogenase C-terminal domain-containing protein n=1 Tax=Laribacter hongkongensis TaxID=168471 RepID=UPI001EFCF8AA|nr:acyl-CoA dehydrogenase C-terminal domain-containing protein [Laribacter hongkongensis]MCG9107163.1 acyl-CoA dehydrogenase C-terminal domain-containing protein [Laribacter hongkongensis]
MSYQAPQKDIRFALEMGELPAVCTLPGFEDCNMELAEAITEEAAKFAEGVLDPINRAGDKGNTWSDYAVTTVPGFKDAFTQFCESGWMGLKCPADFGGQGLPALLSMATEEMWNAANMSFALAPMLSTGAIEALEHNGSDEIKATYLPKLISGEWAGTMNLTEPNAGSDLAQVRTKAVPQADGSYLITGQKIFITWGEHDMTDNIVHLVLARLPDAPAGVKGISLFVVPKFLVNADGSLGARNDVRCVSIEHKLGIHGSPTAVMSFGDQGGAVGYLVGELNKGLAHMFVMMNNARMGVAVQGMAISERAYQQAVEYARDRIQCRELGSRDPASVAIIRHPDVRRMLMTMRAQIEAQRLLTYAAGAALDRAARHPVPEEKARQQALINFLIPIVKGWNTEQSVEITSLGVQVHGGMGFIEETGAAQHFRDARITSIYEGTTGIQAMDLIGRKLAMENGATAKALLEETKAVAGKLTGLGSDFAVFKANLEAGIVQAGQCVDFILARFASEPQLPAAGSVPFLKLMGILLGGWQMARAALVAAERRADPAADVAFYEAKLVTARFYGEHILAQTSGLAAAIIQGGESALALADDAF